MARQAALTLGGRSGLFSLVGRSRWRRRRLSILCFHGIALADEVAWRPGLYITRDQFARRMNRLNSLKANVLPLDEAVIRLREGTLPPRAVVITFDDGGYDFFHHAVPVLSANGFPSTLYLTTYYTGRQMPVLQIALDYLLWKARDRGLPYWPALGIDASSALGVDTARRRVATSILTAVRRRTDDPVARDAVLDELATHLGVDGSALRHTRLLSMMMPDEVQDAARRGVTIELHTHRHRTPRDRTAFLSELAENRDVIMSIVGREPRHFCYPSGDFDADMQRWLAEAGVRTATTCQVALAERGSPAMELPRYLDTSSQSDASFDGWVTGAAAFLSRSTPPPAAVVVPPV